MTTRRGSKRKGTEREARARKMLEACGFDVMRAAGSHGVFDLVAISSKAIRLIQVKTNSKPRPHEMEELRAYNAPGCCTSKEVWLFKDGNKEPVIEEIP